MTENLHSVTHVVHNINLLSNTRLFLNCFKDECSGEGGGNACYKFTTDCRNTVEGHVCDCKDGYSLRFTDIMCVPSKYRLAQKSRTLFKYSIL